MRTAVIFTSKTKDLIAELGGTCWWKTSPRSLQDVTHVVICHNAHDARRPGDHARHGEAFLIGKYDGYEEREDGRKLLKLREVADLSIPNFWGGFRFPVNYVPAQEIEARLAAAGSPMDALEWVPLRKEPVEPAASKVATNKPAGQATGDFVQHVLTTARHAIADEMGIPVELVHVSLTIGQGSTPA